MVTVKNLIRHQWQYIILGIFIALYASIFSYFSILRHDAFASGFDLSNMDQTVWNTLHGRIFELTGTNGTISRFSIHADIFLVLLTPLYLIWDNVRILLIFQSFALALGAIPVFLLARKLFRSNIVSLLFAAIYLINPAMQWTNIYDFHSVAIAIPLLLYTFYFAYTKKWRWFILFACLSLLTKEEISLVIAIMGLLLMFLWREWKIGLLATLSGLLWFLLATFIVIPYFSPTHTHWAFLFYQSAGSEFDLEHLASAPKQIFFNYVINPDDITYYSELLKPFGYLPVLGLPWIVLTFPDLIINLLSTHAQMRSIELHYDSGITPGLIISLLFVVKYIEVLIQKIKYAKKYAHAIPYIFGIGLVLFGLRVNYGYGPLPTSKSCWCITYQVVQQDIAFENLLQTIPQDASITASPEIRPHLTHRENAFTLPDATSSAQFIALIDQNRLVGDYSPKTFELALIKTLNQTHSYDLVSHIGHFYLYKKE